MREELGDDWTKPDLFRIGASSLLSDLERQLYVPLPPASPYVHR